MKKLFLETLIIGMLVLVPSVVIAADKVVTDANERLVAAIVIDCGDVGHTTWKQSLILARQAISLLKAGDELILITAGRDRNVIETTCRIDPDNAGQRTRLNQKLMALKYDWWCRAKIDEALQLAYSELNNRPSGHKCCIVLSDGRYDNSKTDDIRHKAEVYKLSGISLLMTVTGSANKDLLLAGSRGEFDVAITEKSDLAGWFNRVRPQRDTSAVAIAPQPAAPLPVLPTPPSQPPVPQPPVKTEKPPIAVKEHKGFKQLLLGSALLILLAVIAFCIYWIARKWGSMDIKDEIKDSLDLSQHLIAEYHDKLRDLGELGSITTLAFGKLISSAVPLDDQEVNDKEFEISLHGQMLRIRNRANADLTVNGLALKSGKNMELTLPAMIETASGVRISFYLEDSVQNTELIMQE